MLNMSEAAIFTCFALDTRQLDVDIFLMKGRGRSAEKGGIILYSRGIRTVILPTPERVCRLGLIPVSKGPCVSRFHSFAAISLQRETDELDHWQVAGVCVAAGEQ